MVLNRALPGDPEDQMALLEELLRERPVTGNKAVTPKHCRTIASPSRREWGRLVARLFDRLIKQPITDREMRRRMGDKYALAVEFIISGRRRVFAHS